jgi:hypothetical protein
MSEDLKRTLDAIKVICPDYVVAVKHGDFKRANKVLHDKRVEIERKIHNATHVLRDQLDTIDEIYFGEWDSLAWEFRMRLWCGWNPTSEQWVAMKTLGIELESEAGR